jgi:hypothetical protein
MVYKACLIENFMDVMFVARNESKATASNLYLLNETR